ncbi:MAG: DUF6678 family protein [Verrucomicrobiota bacterium]|nr:DUF6678 family protein [Verrucomicrobiota bacterium]
MLTEGQKIDADRLARYIAREQLVSIMNDTKWQRLFNALEPIAGSLSFRRKDVRGTEQTSESWCRDFYHMFGGWISIEWLDITAKRAIPRGALIEPRIQDETPLLIGAVRAAGVAFSRHEAYVRIWGYLRPGVSPKLEK